MPDRRQRALEALMVMSQRSGQFLDGLKQQVEDTKDVGRQALSGSYTAGDWAADVTALWLNGAALVGALYGFPLPPEPAPGDSGAGDDEDASG